MIDQLGLEHVCPPRGNTPIKPPPPYTQLTIKKVPYKNITRGLNRSTTFLLKIWDLVWDTFNLSARWAPTSHKWAAYIISPIYKKGYNPQLPIYKSSNSDYIILVEAHLVQLPKSWKWDTRWIKTSSTMMLSIVKTFSPTFPVLTTKKKDGQMCANTIHAWWFCCLHLFDVHNIC